MSISVEARFDRNNINREEDYEGHLMVTIKAEDEEFERTPVDTILVLDISGSMSGITQSGESKIDSLKRVASKLVENLTGNDEISIVVFSDAVETIVTPTSGGNKQPVLDAISRLRPTMSTNISGGFLEGLRQVNEKFSGVKRVMLLTDGLANSGVTSHEGLVDLVKNRDSSCTLSTFGFGTNANNELLADMAKAGGGNHYYIKDGKDIGNVFARELGGIVSCMAQNINVSIKPGKDNEVMEILNDYTVEDVKGVASIKAEDVYVGETKHVLVKMKIAKPNGKVKNRPFSAAHVDVSYDDLKSKKHEKHDLNVKVKFVKPEDADEKEVLEVQEQVAIIAAAQAHIDAARYADQGNFAMVREVLTSGEAVLTSALNAGSQLVGSVITEYSTSKTDFDKTNYSAEIGVEYASSGRAVRRMKAAGSSSKGFANKMFSNEAQKNMVKSFSEESGTNTYPQKTEEPKVEKPEKTGFGKKRSGKSD